MMARMRMLTAIGALLLLSGCLGKMLNAGPPEALYRFGQAGPVVPGQTGNAARLAVALERVAFAPAIDGDRLIAVHGDSVRYIKGMRWVSAAPGLFGQSVQNSFAARARDLRLLPKTGDGIAMLGLSVDVARFEVRYDDDAMDSVPTVVIEGAATLVRLSDRRIGATANFAARVPAAANRGAAIAAAFDVATAQATAQITDWVEATSVTLPMPAK